MRIYIARLWHRRWIPWLTALGYVLVLLGCMLVINSAYGESVRGENGQLVRPGDSTSQAIYVLGRPQAREVIDTRCDFHRARDRLECVAVKRWDYVLPGKIVSLYIERGYITSITSERRVNF